MRECACISRIEIGTLNQPSSKYLFHVLMLQFLQRGFLISSFIFHFLLFKMKQIAQNL